MSSTEADQISKVTGNNCRQVPSKCYTIAGETLGEAVGIWGSLYDKVYNVYY